MKKITQLLLAALTVSLGTFSASAGTLNASANTVLTPASGKHTFTLGKKDFLLDGKPFQIRSGEMPPQRIPRKYWRQRIQMAKAMGLNTIAFYVFWNGIEQPDHTFDFKGNNDIAAFLKIAKEEGMWVLLRPGPYVCAEWDFGGLPTYLLKDPTIKIRSTNPKYMADVTRYITALAAQVKPYLVTNGGPILMVQVENEFGSYGNDRPYILGLDKLFKRVGFNVPFYTSDGGSEGAIKAGMIPGAAVGLDPGVGDGGYKAAEKVNPSVPVFSSETYPGWLTHWRDKHWATRSVGGAVGQVKWLMDHHKSFNLYMFHGGTSFGFTAGANGNYDPDITSYDYDAPLNEQGRITPKYTALRNLLTSYLAREKPPQTLPPVPAAIPATAIPAIQMQVFTSLWSHMPAPKISTDPQTFEVLDQNQGLVNYQTIMPNNKGGKLEFKDLHDYALVYFDGKFVGTVDRTLHQNSITLPEARSFKPELDILVEGMGHVNFAHGMDNDRKGITKQVSLNGQTVTNWKEYQFPLSDQWAASLKKTPVRADSKALFFKGNFTMSTPADTFFEMKGYQKGVVWVNGHNLGRYWNVGPQYRLYCPATWLKTGMNEILVFDFLQKKPAPIEGKTSLGSND